MSTMDEAVVDKGKEDAIGIQQWLTNRSVLVTGATGFVGSVLCEKLIRSCPGINKVFCLTRGRKGVSAQERMKGVLQAPLFSQLSAEGKNKIVTIDADITESGLCLNEADKKILQDEVSVVFHVAASTNFSSPLPLAANINLAGTKYMLDFAKTCPKVQCFLYVSTAYCNSMVRGPTMETVYPTSVSPRELLELVETKDLTDDDVKNLLGGHSNTYSFTKQLAEELLRTEKERIPVAIVRPSLVLGCHSEPVPGWLSNVLNGGVAFIAGAGKGVFRIVVGHDYIKADIVPVDFVVNQCIAAAWDVVQNPPKNGLSVSHCVSGTQNPVTWGQYCDLIVDAARKNPSQELAFYPAAKCRSNPLRVYLFVYLFQLLPCMILQPFESLFFDARPIISYQQMFIRGIQYVRFFTTRLWIFDDRQARKLLDDRMLPEDRNNFNFDMKRIDWPSYFEICVLGVRHYYHKDTPSTLKTARKLLPLFLFLYYFSYFAFFVITSFILSFFSTIFNAYGIPVPARLFALIATAFVYWL